MSAPIIDSEVSILKTQAAAKVGLGVKQDKTEGPSTTVANVTDAGGAEGYVVPAGSMFTLGSAIPAQSVLKHGMYFPPGTMFPAGVLVPIHQRMVSCQPLQTFKPGPKPAEPVCCIQ